MARIVKKKRKNKFFKLSLFFLLLSIVVRVFASIFLNTYSNNLTISIQKTQQEILDLRTENSKLKIDIQTLQNKDRIFTIAEENGLKQQSNIVSVN